MKKLYFLLLLAVFSISANAQCLSGVYTIGGVNPDYTTITSAVAGLNANGICGPVTFNIRNGTYNEQIVMTAFQGAGANSVVFQSESGDSSAVILSFTGTSAANYIFKLSACPNITFNKIKLQNTSGNYNNCIEVNDCDNFMISNCWMQSKVINAGNSGSSIAQVMYFPNTSSDKITIKNTYVQNGQNGIATSSASTVNSRLKISDCVFSSQYYSSMTGIFKGILIDNNTITSTVSGNPINIFPSTDTIVISNNVCTTQNGGIVVNGSPVHTKLFNNVINASGNAVPLYLTLSGKIFVRHNTVRTKSIYSIVKLVGTGSFDLKNNIFCNDSTGTVYDLTTVPKDSLNFDHNTIYTKGFIQYTSTYDNYCCMNQWKTTGLDVNSLFFRPFFNSLSDLHLSADHSQNAVLPYFPDVSTDKDGIVRDNSSPYYGAYELLNIPASNDASLTELLSPGASTVAGLQSVKVLVKNTGGSALTSATLNWKLNNTPQTPFAWTGSLSPGDTVSVTVGTFSLALNDSASLVVWTSQPNGVADPYNYNDTVKSAKIFTALNGIYTVGGISPDYNDMRVAASDLSKRGISGNVTFNIRPGVYIKKFTISSIPGAEKGYTTTITSEQLSSKAILDDTTGVMKVSNSSNLIFKHLVFGDTTFTVPLSSGLFYIYSGCSNILFDSCIFSPRANASVYFSAPALFIKNVTISNCTALRNSYIVFNGANSFFGGKTIENISLSNNTGRFQVYAGHSDTVLITNNNLFNYLSTNQVFSANQSKAVTISFNQAYTSGNSALYLSASSDVKVHNNYLRSPVGLTTTSLIAISLSECKIYNNTFYMNDAGAGKSIVGMGSNNLSFYNNILFAGPANSMYNLQTANIQHNAGSNCFYGGITGGPFSYYANNPVNTFADWKNIVQSDSNSVIMNPLFTGTNGSDYHIKNIMLKNAGNPVTGLFSTDLDGNARNTSAPDIGADEFTPGTDDLYVDSVLFAGTLCSGNQNISAKVINNGSNPITSFTASWSVNGIIQTPLTWNGNLASADSAILNLGTFNFTPGAPYNVQVWTSLPNGNSDTYIQNDTATRSFTGTGLSGIYTIGGTSPSYTNFAAAVSALKTFGVCGPVLFNVRNGIYNEKVTLTSIAGSGSANTITFKSENNDSNLVTVSFNPGANKGVITFDSGAAYISFEKIQVLTNSGGSFNFHVKNCHNISIRNCKLNSWGAIGVFGGYSGYYNNLLVENSNITTGSTGIILGQSIVLPDSGVIIRGNILTDQTNNGVYLNYSNGAEISNNTIYRSQNTATYVAINLMNTFGAKVNGNTLKLSSTNAKGINITLSQGIAAQPTIVSNNFIITNNNLGLFFSSGSHVNIINNSFLLSGTGPVVHIAYADTLLNYNNIYYAQSATPVMNLIGNYPFIASDKNDYFNTGGTLINLAGINYSSLQAFQAVVPGFDVNSFSIDPLYISSADLHITNSPALSNSGFNTGLAKDIDGEFRSVTPDIGADEFVISGIQYDMKPVTAFIDTGSACPGTHPVFVNIKNLGIDTVSQLTIHYEVDSIPQPVFNWSGQLLQTMIADSIQIGTPVLTTGTHIIKIWLDLPNSVPDQLPANDTIIFTTPVIRMSGVYTVGGTSPDFADLKTAKNALTANGICSAVVLNIRPGIYTDTLLFGPITGSDSLKLVTIKSENNDSTSVVFMHPVNLVNNSNGGNLFYFRNASNISLEKITMMQSAVTTTVTPSFIQISATNSVTCSNISIKNCVFKGNDTTWNAIRLYTGTGTTLKNLNISNNFFEKMKYGISTSGTNVNGMISSNQLLQIKFWPINISSNGTLYIYNNVISNMSATTGYAAVKTGDCNGLEIAGNHIYASNGSGIYIAGTTTANNLKIHNNFVHLTNSSASNGAYLFVQNATADCNFNTFRGLTNNGLSSAIAFYGNSKFSNNIVQLLNGGKIYYQNGFFSGQYRKNNVFYTTGSIFGYIGYTNVASLSQMQSTYGTEANSVIFNPAFIDSTYKITTDSVIEGLAEPVAGITMDIEGKLRDSLQPDPGCYEIFVPALDLVLQDYNAVDTTFCTGTNNISITVKNNGSDTVTSFDVNWEVNNVVQPVYTWSGILLPGTSVSVTVGSVSCASMLSYSLKFESANPNGQQDQLTNNDILITPSYKTRLAGLYTIGGISPDFADVQSARDSLYKFGICGATTFDIRDGIYFGSLKFYGVIPGASAFNDVTFRSESGDSSLVWIKDTVVNTTNHFATISLSLSGYINFRKLGIESPDNNSIAAVQYAGINNNITIENCYLKTNISSGTGYCIKDAMSTLSPGLYSIGTNISNNRFDLTNSVAINFTGLNPQIKLSKVNFTGNHLKGIGFFVANFKYYDSLTINSNRIIDTTASNGLGGIKIEYAKNSFSVEQNYLFNVENPLQVQNCKSTYNAASKRIVNNIFILSGPASSSPYVASLENSDDLRFYHNTLSHLNSTSSSIKYACLNIDSVFDSHIINNILYNKTFNYAFSFTNYDFSRLTHDNNIVYAPGDTMAELKSGSLTTYGISLAGLRMKTSGEYNSVKAYPQFQSSLYPLPVNDYLIDNTGAAVGSVTTDFEGSTRSAASPDPGAFEFSSLPVTLDVGITDFNSSAGTCYSSSPGIYAKVKNFGNDTVYSFSLIFQRGTLPKDTVQWNGILAAATETLVFLDSLAFQNPAVLGITGKVELPNGTPDAVAANDSLSYSFLPASLGGTFTVGSATSDFLKIQDAIDYIEDFGVCGPVTFNILPGVYDEVLLIDSISGTSAVNTVTLQSSTGNGSQVIIRPTYYLNNTVNSYSIRLQNVSFINFRNLTIDNGAGSVSWGGNVLFLPNVRHIEFSGNKFLYTSNIIDAYLVWMPNATRNISFVKNTFENGNIALYSTIRVDTMDIKENIFTDQEYVAIWIKNHSRVLIDSNQIFKSQFNGVSFTQAAIDISADTSELTITRNIISGEYASGMQLYSTYKNSPVKENYIHNNVIIGGANMETAAELMLGNLHFNYNSMRVPTWGLLLNPGINDDIEIHNNILVTTGTGYLYYFYSGAPSGITASNNVYYGNGSNLFHFAFGNYSSLASYQSAFGIENNSVFADPQFVSATDLHYQNSMLDSNAVPITGITHDQQNKLRDPLFPNPGAYEAFPDTIVDSVSKYLHVSSISNAVLNVGVNNYVTMNVQFDAPPFTDTATTLFPGSVDSLYMYYQINNGPVVTELWLGQLNVYDSLSYTFTTPYFLAKPRLMDIKVWFIDPNSLHVDINHTDDSLKLKKTLPLKGDYTVGGTSPDFADFQVIRDNLYYCGTDSSCRFLFRTGYYDMYGNMQASNFPKPIIGYLEFRSEQNNPTGVDFAFCYLGFDSIKFRQLTLHPYFCSGSVYTYSGTWMSGIDITIDSCALRGKQSILGKPGLCIGQSLGEISVRNSTFRDFDFAVAYNSYIYSAAGSFYENHYFVNNDIDSVYEGIVIAGYPSYDTLFISDNIIHTTGASVKVIPVEPVGRMVINYNDIKSDSGLAIDAECTFCSYNTGSFTVYNNFISGTGSRFEEPSMLRLINNSFSGHVSVRLTSTTDTILNNIFVSDSVYGAFSIKYNTAFTPVIDNNDYYSPNAQVLCWYDIDNSSYTATNIQQIKSITGQDSSSLNVDPKYISATDFHSLSSNLQNHGQPVAFVLDDFDGESRSVNTPDIGADEIQIIFNDVWPGDANNDQSVDAQDLIPIGVHFGMTGPARDSISNTWLGHTCANWSFTQTNGLNAKFVDCNGDSTVNFSDTAAITINFGNTHSKLSSQAATQNSNSDFQLIFNKPFYLPGDTVIADIYLGSSAAPLTNFYGVVFKIGFNGSLYKNSGHMLNIHSNWSGTLNQDLLRFTNLVVTAGNGQAAFVRNTHTDTSGYGKIGVLQLLLKDSISSGNDVISIISAYKADTAGNLIPINGVADTIQIIPVSVPEVESIDQISVYPNPFQGNIITIKNPTNEVLYIELIDEMGRVIQYKKITNGNNQIILDSDFTPGIYFIKIYSDKEQTVKMVKLTKID